MSDKPVIYNVTDTIREKVRETILTTIPDENIDAMIMAEYQQFFHDETDQRGYVIEKSPFNIIVREELDKTVRQAIREWLDENFEKHWSGQEYQYIGEMVSKLTPVVLEGISSRIINQALQHIEDRLRAYK